MSSYVVGNEFVVESLKNAAIRRANSIVLRPAAFHTLTLPIWILGLRMEREIPRRWEASLETIREREEWP